KGLFTWEVLGMCLGGSTEIENAATGEGNDITCTSVSGYLPVEFDVAEVGRINLSPLDRRSDLRLIEPGTDHVGFMRVFQYQRLAVRKIVGTRIETIIDVVPFKACFLE